MVLQQHFLMLVCADLASLAWSSSHCYLQCTIRLRYNDSVVVVVEVGTNDCSSLLDCTDPQYPQLDVEVLCNVHYHWHFLSSWCYLVLNRYPILCGRQRQYFVFGSGQLYALLFLGGFFLTGSTTCLESYGASSHFDDLDVDSSFCLACQLPWSVWVIDAFVFVGWWHDREREVD